MTLIRTIGQDFSLEKIVGGHWQTELLRFRHKIFREQLRWLPESINGLDADEYDAFSEHFAVFRHRQIIGSIRFTPGHCPFMIEREFAALLPAHSVIHKGQDSAEITRFAVGQDEHGRSWESAVHLLYYCIYHWAQIHQIRWMYFVVEPLFFRRLLHLGGPVFRLGKALPLEGGVISQAGVVDLQAIKPSFIKKLYASLAPKPPTTEQAVTPLTNRSLTQIA